MGAPRQGINPATRVRGPLDGGAHTVSATAAKRPAPARGRCLPNPSFESGAVHSRGATDRAPTLWSGPRPHPIARRAHCGRAGHPPKGVRPSTLGAPPQPPPPTQASPWMSTADGRAVGCGQPEANTPPLGVTALSCACGLQVPCWVPASHLLICGYAQSGASGHASGASVAGVVEGCGSGVVRTG